MQLIDVLHYYVGHSCLMTKSSYHAVHELHLSVKEPFILSGKLCQFFIDQATKAEVKPILRRLEDMTDEEAKEFLAVNPDDRGGKHYLSHDKYGVYWKGAGVSSAHISFALCTPQSFHYLLSRGFDLFSLIDAGSAVDQKYITNTKE